MRAVQLMRLGAVCAFLYTVVFLAGQAYLSSQPQAKYPQKSTLDEQARIFLTYAHQHGDLVVIGSLLAILGYALLAGVMVGLTPALQPSRQRLARIALVVGLASVAVIIAGVSLEAFSLAQSADHLAAAHTAAAQQAAIKDFRDKTVPFQLVDVVGSLGIALWLGLVGLTLIRIYGRSSMAGWGTIGSCLLTGIGFPVLVAWCAGAGLGLWRLSRSAMSVPAYDSTIEDDEPISIGDDEPFATGPAPVRPRAAGARGSKGRRKRRR